MNKRSVLLLLWGCLSGLAHGQTKFEREYRIREDAVPAPALAFIQALEWEGKVKWYMEEGLNQKSIEAKVRYRKQLHSIEFDLSGAIQDIEVGTRRDEMDESVLKAIDAIFSTDFERHKITKIQRQYSGAEDALLRLMRGGGEENTTTRYEIIVRGRKAGRTDFYEYTFSAQGSFVGRSMIVLRNADNLEF